MPGWWPFSTASEVAPPSVHPYDEYVPQPTGGAMAPPPEKPASLKSYAASTASLKPSQTEALPSSSLLSSTQSKWTSPTSDASYAAEDLSAYSSPYHESSGVLDDKYAASQNSSWNDWGTVNPRVKTCLESVKMGVKMGAAVGGIFGTLTGLYASVVNRSVLLLPLSVAGGAVTFGFFLGCGVLVRCDEKKCDAQCPSIWNAYPYATPFKPPFPSRQLMIPSKKNIF